MCVLEFSIRNALEIGFVKERLETASQVAVTLLFFGTSYTESNSFKYLKVYML